MVKFAPSLIVAALTIASSSSLAAPTPTTAPEPELVAVSVDDTGLDGRNKKDEDGLLIAAELRARDNKVPTIARSIPAKRGLPSASDNIRRSIPLFASGTNLHKRKESLNQRDLVTTLGLAGALAPLGLGSLVPTVEGVVDGLPIVGPPVDGIVQTVDGAVGLSSLLDPVAPAAAPASKRQLGIPSPLASLPIGNDLPTSIAQLEALEAELSALGLAGSLPSFPNLNSILGMTRSAYTQPNQDASALDGIFGGLPGGASLGGVTGELGGLSGTLGGVTGELPLGGLSGTLGGVTGELPLSGVTGELGGVAGGLTGGLGGLGGLTGSLGGLTGGAGGLTGATGGLEGLAGGLSGTAAQVTNDPLGGLSVAGAEAAGLLPPGFTSGLAATLAGSPSTVGNGFHRGHGNDTMPASANDTAPAPNPSSTGFPFASGMTNVRLPGQYDQANSASAPSSTLASYSSSVATATLTDSAPVATSTPAAAPASPVTDSGSEYSDDSDEEDETAPILVGGSSPTTTSSAWNVQSSSTMAPTPSSAAATAEAMSMTASEAGTTAAPTTTGAAKRWAAYVD